MMYDTESKSSLWQVAFAEARARAERTYGVGSREAEDYATVAADLVEAESEAGAAAPLVPSPAAAPPPVPPVAAVPSPEEIRAGWKRAFAGRGADGMVLLGSGWPGQ